MKNLSKNPTKSFLTICGTAIIMNNDIKDPILRKEKTQSMLDTLFTFHFNHSKSIK